MEKKEIRVLQMVPLGAGGITSLVLNIAGQLDKSRVCFDYLTFHQREEYNEKRALALGGRKIVVPTDKYENAILRGIYKFFGTISILKKEDIDILHINASVPYDIVVGISAKLAGVKKVVFHSHTSSMRQDGSLRARIMPLCQKLIPLVSDCNMACSELAANYMFSPRMIDTGKVLILKNAISTEKYIYNRDVREAYRKKLGVENCFVVGHVGRFVEAKNHEKLLTVFKAFLTKCPEAVLLLAGSGEKEEKIHALVTELEIQDSVRFLGRTDEVPQLLQAMDFFLFPSLFEGLPVGCVEAQAACLPVLISDTVTKEVQITDLAQYCSLEQSDDEWADKMISMITAHVERKNMLQEIVNSGFDIQDVTEQLMRQYEALMEKE